MGLYQKFSELDIDGVYQAYIGLDRAQYPQRAIELKNELEHRKAHGEVPSDRYALYAHDVDAALKRCEPKDPDALSLEFSGTARQYFRIWIVNLCLTLLTLGIFSAWGKVRKKRYFYSHTRIAGTPFQYLGQPIPILKGRLVAVIGFGAYYISSNFANSLLPYVLAAGLIAAPWILVSSAAFNARYSAFRNMTFHLEAGYRDAMKVLYFGCILPAFVIGIMFDGFGQPLIFAGISLVFVISIPWLICRIKKFIVESTFYGSKKGEFSARGGQFFKIYLASVLIIAAVSIPVGFVLTLVFIPMKKTWLMPYIAALPMYVGYVIGFAYVRAKSSNLVWNSTRLGPLRFQSTLEVGGLGKLYLTNALGIIASCGVLIPWAVMRTLKYRAEHLKVFKDGELSEFVGSQQQSVAAAGAETLDLFDWDLAL
jgi:uncharacterized membrane protein YjgN (DUF898 family)